MILYNMQKYDNPNFKNNKPSSYVKRSHLRASPVKLIFVGYPLFHKIGAIFSFRQSNSDTSVAKHVAE
jgi:hypothetical protein